VIPGGVVLLQMFVGVLPFVDSVGAEVEIVVDGLRCVTDAGGAGRLGSGSTGDVVAVVMPSWTSTGR